MQWYDRRFINEECGAHERRTVYRKEEKTMCTAATYLTKNHYFGRNLDLEFSYHETVTITPRRKPFAFRHMGTIGQHQAMIGMAFVVGDYPLYLSLIHI